MIRKLRKGFTIVELVIVIAVIAVLTAVLIPTFVHLSKKANKASDSSLVANLNTALKIEEGESGKKPVTMHDAVLGLENQGYKVPQLVTKSGEELVYSVKENKFFLSGDVTSNYVDYWHIDSKMPSTQKWSIYAYAWETTKAENLTVGFDAGVVDKITSVSYVRSTVAEIANPQEVIIRTNGGTLTINAEADTVHHYGDGVLLDIKAIAGSSYHEFGKITEKAVISQGHLELEEGGSVPQVFVQNATGAVTVTANEPTIVIADSASASQTNIVANSQDVYVSGVSTENISGSESSSVSLAQDVTDNATLKSSLANGGFIRIANAITVSQAVEVPNGKTAVVDFNGKLLTYSSNWLWENHGTLTVTDSGENGGITCGKGAIDNYGTLIVNGGSYSSSIIGSGATIWNNPDANIVFNNCSIEAARTALVNEGLAIVNGGNFNSTSTSANGNGNYAYCIISQTNTTDAEITINGGTVTGIHGAISISSGKGIINDVNASTKEGDSYSHYALYAAGEEGTVNVTVNGGTFVGGYISAANIGNKNKNGDGGIGAPAYVNFYGGRFIAPSNAEAVHVSFSEDGFGIGYAFMYGGTYSTQPADKYIGAGLSAVRNSDGTFTVQ